MATQGKILVYKRQGKKGTTYTYRLEAGRDPITGKRKRVSKSGFKTAKEARAAAQPILNKLLLGENIIESDITFSEYADEWFNGHCIGLKLYTKRNIQAIIAKLNKYFGNMKIKDINLYTYQQFLNNLSTNVSKNTLKIINSYAKMIFKNAEQYNIIRVNPTTNSKIPKYEEVKIDVQNLYLTKDELNTLISYAKNYNGRNSEYFYYLLIVLAYTGMRIGEICSLLWSNIDFANKRINVNSSIFAENNSKYIRQNTPKTKESIRTIIIDDILIQILKEWKIKQLEIRIQYGTQNKKDDLDFVFTKYNPTNNTEIPVLPKNIQAIFYRINKHKLLKKMIHPHIIRHTHASLLAEAGIPLEIIQERLGHSSDIITRKIYLHITEKEKLNAAKIFSKYMQEIQ